MTKWTYSSSRSMGGSRLKAFFVTSTALHMLCIIAVCIAAYSNTFHVAFQLDDESEISDKSFVRDISSFFDMEQWRTQQDHGFRMRTIGYLSFALNYKMRGTHVVGYHVVNLAIHIMNGLLVYWLVSLTFRTPYFSAQHAKLELYPAALIALFTALIFVSHPIQTQAVTYIVQRLTSFATLWYLLGIGSYVRWRTGKSSGLKAMSWYVLSLVSLVLGMKTKEIVFTAPLVICLYEFMFFEGPLKKRISYLIPLLSTMLIIPVSLLGIAKPLGEVIGDVSEVTRVQTGISRWDYLLTEFRVIVTYLRLLILPFNQNLDYDYPVYRSFFGSNVFLSFLLLSAFFGTGVYFCHKSRVDGHYKQREVPTAAHSSFSLPFLRLVAFGIFWFFITLSVESGIIPIADVIFEHRLYLPSIGFIVGLVCTVKIITDSREMVEKFKISLFVPLFAILVVLLSMATFLRNGIWADSIRLAEDTVSKSPAKARPHVNLGFAYDKSKSYDAAAQQYQLAIKLNPFFGSAYTNLGNIYSRRGRFEEAIRLFKTVLEFQPENTAARSNLGVVYLKQGRTPEAVEEFKVALAIKPDEAGLHNNLGNAYQEQGSLAGALKEYQAAIANRSDYADAYNNLGLIYGQQGQFSGAIWAFQRAKNLDPDSFEAYNNLGIVFMKQGNVEEALQEFRHAIKLNPGSAEIHLNIGIVYLRKGFLKEAATEMQSALNIAPDNREAQHYLEMTKKRMKERGYQE